MFANRYRTGGAAVKHMVSTTKCFKHMQEASRILSWDVERGSA